MLFRSLQMKILFEDNHCLVIEKPINIPMQADDSKDLDIVTMAKNYLREKYAKPGNVYCGLVHRLDRPVGGVVVLAKTSKAAARLSDSVRKHELQKTYSAVVTGPLPKQQTLIDYLIKDESTNRSRVTDASQGKLAQLSFTVIRQRDALTLIEIDLKTGRSHQIRVQFASRDCPLWGDQRYHKNALVGQQIALWATRLRFPHPITNVVLSFESPLPNTKPWNLF